ncbi:hypothetical protein RchiOBHm_Chr4g0397151 [Rosa chinensis]|uniref:Uncharacterized protein n=1 Tax=Rosa chinensis TaxID=74649 RepID=A0A2P6QS13_ROSCH|nr:hypothetical protein RchiOBHm_Chr4g0397151 [Rosa chinensis]
MADLSPRCEISFLQTFLCSAFAACFTEFCTIKLDTATVLKVMQLVHLSKGAYWVLWLPLLEKKV